MLSIRDSITVGSSVCLCGDLGSASLGRRRKGGLSGVDSDHLVGAIGDWLIRRWAHGVDLQSKGMFQSDKCYLD